MDQYTYIPRSEPPPKSVLGCVYETASATYGIYAIVVNYSKKMISSYASEDSLNVYQNIHII